MTENFTIAITGATGFIGRHTVDMARKHGYRVRALVRNPEKVDAAWKDDPDIEIITIDFSSDNAVETIKHALEKADAIIHAAASLTGNDDFHQHNTIKPLKVLLQALEDLGSAAPNLVLVSSLTVYDLRKLAEGELLSEKTPLESRPAERDPYCRSKLLQEELAIKAAGTHDLQIRIMRPGAVFGPNQLWNSHIGIGVGPLLVQLEQEGEVPLTYVEHCADALIRAAVLPIFQDDRENANCKGRVEIINIFDPDRPDRNRFLEAMRKTGWPRITWSLSWGVLSFAAAILWPVRQIIGAKLPGLLRPAILHARHKPVRYDDTLLTERLGYRAPYSFEQAMERAVRKEKDGEA